MIQYIFLRQVISLGNDTKKSYTISLIVLAVLAICAVSILVLPAHAGVNPSCVII